MKFVEISPQFVDVAINSKYFDIKRGRFACKPKFDLLSKSKGYTDFQNCLTKSRQGFEMNIFAKFLTALKQLTFEKINCS